MKEIIKVLVFIALINTCNGQVPADSLKGIYIGKLYGKTDMDTNWSVINLSDTVYVTNIDSGNCTTLLYGSIFCYSSCNCNLYTEYSFCNIYYNPVVPGYIYPKFFSYDSLMIYLSWPDGPPFYTMNYRKFLGKRVPGSSYVGIREQQEEEKIKLAPNPANDLLEVEFYCRQQVNGDILIIRNIAGVIVKNESVDKNRLFINVGDLSPGLYFFEWNHEGLVYKEKFVISR